MRPLVFFFNDTATTEIYTLSLHDALPISITLRRLMDEGAIVVCNLSKGRLGEGRSEEHTSELQSRSDLVCRLLLEKKISYLFSMCLLARVGTRSTLSASLVTLSSWTCIAS